MDILIILYNKSLIQASILKCVNRPARDFVYSNCVNCKSMDLVSYDLFCDFNISPAVFLNKQLNEKILKGIVLSGDPQFIRQLYDIGWKYDYETIIRVVTTASRANIDSLSLVKTLRELGCHWGVVTLQYFIGHSMTEHVEFCIEDRYPITTGHVHDAIICGTPKIMRLVINSFLESSQIISSHTLSKDFRYRLQYEENEDVKKEVLKIRHYLMEIGVVKD